MADVDNGYGALGGFGAGLIRVGMMGADYYKKSKLQEEESTLRSAARSKELQESAAIQTQRDETIEKLKLKYAPLQEAAKRAPLIAAGKSADEEIARRSQPGSMVNDEAPPSAKERGLIRAEALTGAGYVQEGEAVRRGAMDDLSRSEIEGRADVRQERSFGHAERLQELNHDFQIDLQAFQQEFMAGENEENRAQALSIARMQMGNALAIANAHAAPVQDAEGQFFVRTIGKNGVTETSYLIGPDRKPMKGQKDMTAAQKALIEPVTVMIRETARDTMLDAKDKAAKISEYYKELQGIIKGGAPTRPGAMPTNIDVEALKKHANNPEAIKAFEARFKTSAAYFLSGSEATTAANAVTGDFASSPGARPLIRPQVGEPPNWGMALEGKDEAAKRLRERFNQGR